MQRIFFKIPLLVALTTLLWPGGSRAQTTSEQPEHLPLTWTIVKGPYSGPEEALTFLRTGPHLDAPAIPRYSREQYWALFNIPQMAGSEMRLLIRNKLIGIRSAWLVREEQISPVTLETELTPQYRIPSPDGLPLQVLINMDFPFQARLQPILVTRERAHRINNMDSMILYCGLGMAAAMILYNLFVFILIREKSHAMYLGYAVAAMFMMAMQGGLVGMYKSPGNLQTEIAVLAIVTIIMAFSFTRTFLNTRTNAPRLHVVSKVLSILCLAGFLPLLTGHRDLHLAFFDGLLVAASLAIVSAGLASWRAGYRPAAMFLAAWLVLCSSVIVWVLGNWGAFTLHMPPDFILNFGIAAEMIMISLALADKVRLLRSDLIGAMRQQNLLLEERVRRETDLIKTQQSQLLESTKLSSLGVMAAGIAHEINNPLAIIQGNAELIGNMAARTGSPDIRGRSETIITTVGRIRTITSALLAYARHGDHDEFRTENMVPVVRDVIAMARSRIAGRPIVIEDAILCTAVEARVRSGQIMQIVVNLINNSIDAVATSGNGKITVNITGQADMVHVTVEDNGPGIPEEIRDQIFDPFFSTKPIGSGTGLGLSISAGIASSHGGRLVLEISQPGKTVFRLDLPGSGSSLRAA